jgi:hypothetical protein
MGLLCSGLGAAAHCPTHIINSSDKPWILASTQIQETLTVKVLHREGGGPLAQGTFSPAQGGYFIMPAHSIVVIEAQDGATYCVARFRLMDHTWQYPLDYEVIYAAPAGGGPQVQAGSLRHLVPEAAQFAASVIVREPTPVILQILRNQWNGQPAPEWSSDEEAAAQPRADSSASTSSSETW